MVTTKSINDKQTNMVTYIETDSLRYSSSSEEKRLCPCLPKWCYPAPLEDDVSSLTDDNKEYVSPTTSEEEWRTVQSKKQRQKSSSLPQNVEEQKMDFDNVNELNAHLTELEKSARKDSFARKLKSKIGKRKLQHQNGIFGIVDDIKSVSENFSTLVELSRSLSRVKDIVAYESSDRALLFDNICARVEDLTALCVALTHAENWQTSLAVIHLYIRTFCPKSVISSILRLVTDCFGVRLLETQAGFDTDSVSSYISSVKEVIKSWTHFRYSECARNLANMVDILATFGIVSCTQTIDDKVVKRLNIFRNSESKQFSIKAWNIQRESVDFISMALETITFFIERGYSAIMLKDPMALLYDDRELAQLDAEFSVLTSAMPLIEAGRLDELSTPESVKSFGVSPILDEADFDIRLERLIMSITKMISLEKNPAFKNSLSQKLTMLARVRTAYILQQKREPMRVKPFGIMVYGKSSVGKSHIVSALVTSVLHANNFAHSREHIVTMNDLDKYDSEYTSKHTAVIFDDYGNAVPQTYETAPTKRIIDYLNNIPLTAVKADLASKGNVMIKPKVVALTTNVKNLLANVFSNEPVSVMRRLDIIVEARLKSEFVDPETGGPLKHKMCDDIIPDAWEICLQRVKIQRGRTTDSYNFVDVMTGKVLLGDFHGTWIDFYDAQQIIVKMSKDHFVAQQNFLSNVNKMYDIKMCKHSWPGGTDSCRLCTIERNVLSDIGRIDESESDRATRIVSTMLKLDKQNGEDDDSESWHSLPTVITPTILQSVVDNHVPSEPYEITSNGRIKILRDRKDELEDSLRKTIHSIANPQVVEPDEDSEDFTFQKYFQKRSANLMQGFGVLLMISAVIVVSLSVYKTLTKKYDEQGGDVSKPIKLETDVPNPWKQVSIANIPRTLESRTATLEQVTNFLFKKMGFAKIRRAGTDDVKKVCNIVPLCNNFWILPSHILNEEIQYEIEVIFKRKDELGKHIKQHIIPEDWIKVPDTDYVVVKLVTGGENADIRKFFPLEPVTVNAFTRLHCDTIWKGPDGEQIHTCIPLQGRQIVTVGDLKYDAYLYQCSQPTFKGQCMMALISHTKSPVILGFHLSGLTGETQGAAGVVFHTMFDDSISTLKSRYAFVAHSGGDAVESVIGKLVSTPINPHHSVHFLQNDDGDREPTLEVWGPHEGGSVKFRSNVKKSIISDAVTEHMDLPKKHGAPNTKCINKHWQRDLQTISCPRTMYDRYVLKHAMNDMWNKWETFIDNDENFQKIVHPYDWDTVFAGADGITSVDAIDLNTSMGWPINKSKKTFFTPSERLVDGITRPLDIDPEILEQVEYLERELQAERRIYTIFRACLKDEPKKLDSKKIRIFAGCSTPFLLLCRKYLLSVIRYMQTNWLHFECAVGINAHGPEWSTLAKFVSQFNEDQCIAGDYSSYDKIFSPLCLESVYELWCKICVKAGYSELQMKVVRGLVTELIYPVYEWDGVLIQTFASNPSGHFGTVHVNGHANEGPFLRYAYMSHAAKILMPNRQMWEPITVEFVNFCDYVALMTYGDDFLANISRDEPYGFNFLVAQEELSKIGIVLTPEDKTDSVAQPFKHLTETTFLKRKFLLRPDLDNLYTAPLEEASISKSLHNYLYRKKSPALPDEISAQAIQGALREWFRYPKEHFEMRRSQLEKVVEVTQLSDLVGPLPTYDQYRAELLEKVPIVKSIKDFDNMEFQ